MDLLATEADLITDAIIDDFFTAQKASALEISELLYNKAQMQLLTMSMSAVSILKPERLQEFEAILLRLRPDSVSVEYFWP